MLLLPPELYAEWVRFVEPHLSPALRGSITHQVCRAYVSAVGSREYIRYVWRLIREYPDQYAAFTALMRMTGKLPS